MLWVAMLGALPFAGFAGETDERERIADAVRVAYGLERDYWQSPESYPDWESVYAHYRKGFSASLAEEMTEFTLDSDGNFATWVPDRVHVVDHGDEFALAWFRTAEDFGEEGLWDFEEYMVVRLRREGERWVVYWATDSAVPPAR
ncbi:MAG: hypothetical protein K9M02_11270 [Thiohalocapsa sp.]|nr:hypothetical protein [Thiohalocapsa sp.]